MIAQKKLAAHVLLIGGIAKRKQLSRNNNSYSIHVPAWGLILTWTRINVFCYIACCIIHLAILFNIFKLHSR